MRNHHFKEDSMRNILIQGIIFFILSFIFIMSVRAAETYTAENYKIDAKHSYVLWQISHFGFSEQTGKWYAEGELQLDEKNPQNSKVNAIIRLEDMVTGISKLDEHLKKEDFFDIANYPNAKFISNKIIMTGKDSAKVEGMLTLHGVSKPVVLNVKLRKVGMSPITNKMTAGFTATAKLKRSDFGMKTYLPGLGDEVKILIEVEAYKENKK